MNVINIADIYHDNFLSGGNTETLINMKKSLGIMWEETHKKKRECEMISYILYQNYSNFLHLYYGQDGV